MRKPDSSHRELHIPDWVGTSAKRYLSWLLDQRGLNAEVWREMMPVGQPPSGSKEKDFVKIMQKFELQVDKKESKIGWNDQEKTLFFFIKWKGCR